jgi:Sec-independent protein secretion pathway component TatC
MFYIKEIFFRFQYFFISFLFVSFISYYHKNILLFLLTFAVVDTDFGAGVSGVDHFICTHPSELLTIYITLVLYVSFIIILPQFFWQILDFLKSSLFRFEYKNFFNFIVTSVVVVVFFNLLCFLTLFPNFWIFFESFNKLVNKDNILNVFLELRLYDYFLFLKDFIYLTNFCLFFLFVLCFVCFCYGLKFLVHWKKLFIFINIVFATLLSPPDVYSQLLILVVLTFIFEFIIFFYTFYCKLLKYLKMFNKEAY